MSVAGKTETPQFPVCLNSSHFGVTQAKKKPYWQVVPCPGNSNYFFKGVRSSLQGVVPVSQTPRKGSTLAHYLQSAQPPKLFLDNLCRMCKVCKLKQCGENFHPDGKLTENDKGPDPDPTQASSYIPLFFPGTEFRPKHFTQIYPTMISNTPSSKKYPPFL